MPDAAASAAIVSAMPEATSARGGRRAKARRLASSGLLLAAAVGALAAAVPVSVAGASTSVDASASGVLMKPKARRDAVMTQRLPRPAWVLSLDVRVAARTRLALKFGTAAPLRIRRGTGSTTVVQLPGGRRVRLNTGQRGPWTALHLQVRRSPRASISLVLGQSAARIRARTTRRLDVSVGQGKAVVGPLLVTPLRDTASLLLHRVADLDARVPASSFLVGADLQDRLYFSARSWTRGFLAGALWQAGTLVPGRDQFEQAALKRTRATFGYETADTHDLGFVYENSSLAAYHRLCGRGTRLIRTCEELRTSGLDAADRLLELAQTNLAGGTIPTSESRPSPTISDTLIDSMMNLSLLYWASDVTHDPIYRDTAATHAHRVSQLLVRPNGSTAQSVHLDRTNGRVLLIHTHQGLSASSTWARGQAWAVYGFTTSAATLRDRELLRTAERTAGWVADHLPASGVPPYDYDAVGGPSDTSAGVIAAAGAMRLGRLCARWKGACAHPGRWLPLGRRLLQGALRHVSRTPPLGYLGQQVGTLGSETWDDDAELIYGLRYALEAVKLSRSR